MTYPKAGDAAGDTLAPTEDRIAARAYELYVARGREDGYDVADWLQAEAELLAQTAETASPEGSAEGALRPRLAPARQPESQGPPGDF